MDETYNTYTTTSLENGSSASTGIGVGLIVTSLIMAIALYVYSAITLGKIFKKAGIASWIAWVPFYNAWKIFELGEFSGALSLLVLIPFVGPFIYLVLAIIAYYRIGLSFGKSGAFVLLAVFLAPIWLGILAFGKAQWKNQGQNQQQAVTNNNQPTGFQPTNSFIFQNQPIVQDINNNPENQVPVTEPIQSTFDKQPQAQTTDFNNASTAQPLDNNEATEQPVFTQPVVEQTPNYQPQQQTAESAPETPVAPVTDFHIEPRQYANNQSSNPSQPVMPQPTKEPVRQQDSDYNNKIFPNQ